LWSTPLFALFGCAGVYVAGRGLVGRGAALLAAALLALSPAEVWFGRTPMAEAAAQCWIWGGFAGLTRDLAGTDRRVGLLAGACWGLAALTRAEALLLAPVFLGVLILAARLCGRAVWPLLAGFAPLVAQAVVYAATSGRTYATFLFAHTPPVRTLLLLAPLALLLPLLERALPRLAAA